MLIYKCNSYVPGRFLPGMVGACLFAERMPHLQLPHMEGQAQWCLVVGKAWGVIKSLIQGPNQIRNLPVLPPSLWRPAFPRSIRMNLHFAH